MTKLDWALRHAARGFWVFRLQPDGKLPNKKGWQSEATRDPDRIRDMWAGKNADCNIGAFTSRFGDDGALIAVDVDNKNGKRGDDTMFDLDMSGKEFPATYENNTPTGGRHVVYTSKQAVKQGADVLGEGLDIRSRGGFIVMAGSTVGAGTYKSNGGDPAEAPGWLYSKLLLETSNASTHVKVDSSKIDPVKARARCAKFMEEAPSPDMGSRNDTAFKVACELRDRGADIDMCAEFVNAWNETLEAPIDEWELDTTIGSAYKSGQNAVGAKAAESIFEPVDSKNKKGKSPFDAMNDQFAFVIAGGGHHVLWETTDERGEFKLEHLNEQSFHKMLAHKTIELGNGKRSALSKLWISDMLCRRYDGLVFAPGKEVDQRFYNMWRGFPYEPIKSGEAVPQRWQDSVDKFLEHALVNVCANDAKLFHYLMSYFAQLIQKPGTKPLVSLVFKGGKGVGKNALIERVAALISPHYTIADDRRYLTSNFNGHLESCLLLILDEAFWSGDKEAEGKLKSMITGQFHNIEHKGKEAFKVRNLTRVAIIGNEDWLVPATHDERRFAVFSVSDGRQQDRQFFQSMREGMESGGYRLLLSYFLNYDTSGVDVNQAPMTPGLIEQKHASLEPFEQWWLDCLMENRLVGLPGSGVTLEEINTDTFRNAFAEYARRRQIRTRLPDERQIGRSLAKVARTMKKKRAREGGEIAWHYVSDGVTQLRRDWEYFIGGPVEWPVNQLEDLACLS